MKFTDFLKSKSDEELKSIFNTEIERYRFYKGTKRSEEAFADLQIIKSELEKRNFVGIPEK